MTRVLINLGAGNRIIGAADDVRVINHDRVAHRAEIEVVHDLNALPWPWGDEVADYIEAWAVLEHLTLSLLESVDECWRILKVGGLLHVKLPYWDHAISYQDPTHRSVYDLAVFDAFDPSTERGRQYAFYGQRPWVLLGSSYTDDRHASICATLRKKAT